MKDKTIIFAIVIVVRAALAMGSQSQSAEAHTQGSFLKESEANYQQ